MSSLIPFSFESSSLRFIPNGESFSVIAKDVLSALEYTEATISNIGDAIKHVPGEWKGRVPIPTPGGIQEMLTLTEQGFYFFVNRSDKPKALPLQKWVAGEVLPSIRQTGGYRLPGTGSDNAILAAQLSELLKDKVLVDRTLLADLTNAAHALRPLVDAVETVIASSGGPVATRRPARPEPYRRASDIDGALVEFIARQREAGAGHRILQQRCWAYRSASAQDREDALNRLLDQGTIVQIKPEPTPGLRPWAAVYVALAFAEKVSS